MNKTGIFLLHFFALMIAGIASAEERTTLVLKNGSKIVGNIIAQRPNTDVTINASSATFIIDENSVVSMTPKKIKYEELDREWKRWALEHKALKGNENGRYLVLFDIKTRTHNHNGLAKIERNETPKVVYVQIRPETYKFPWKEISKIEKSMPSANEITGVDDVVITQSGKTYYGTIVQQIPGKKIVIKSGVTSHEVLMTDVIEIRKKARSTSFSINEQTGYKNIVVLKDKKTKEGVIVAQHYGKLDKDKYITIQLDNKKTEKVLTSNISEYKTVYPERKKVAYNEGKMYVNEFKIPLAKIKEEGENVYYVDKSVFPFPEGIVITFKTKGAKLQSGWELVALEMLKMENGTTTQGYTGKSRTENAISPSTRDLSDGVSSISFTYLSPGYYALVNNDSMETYIIKITK